MGYSLLVIRPVKAEIRVKPNGGEGFTLVGTLYCIACAAYQTAAAHSEDQHRRRDESGIPTAAKNNPAHVLLITLTYQIYTTLLFIRCWSGDQTTAEIGAKTNGG